MAAFRDTYSKLHEMRALAPSVKMIALTATSTQHTRKIIMDVLLMENPYIVYESPNKPNIAYSVCYMPKGTSIDKYFAWLCDELKLLGICTTRTIIYCQTIKQCSLVYSTFKAMLGNNLFIGESHGNRNILVEMMHSCTPEANKACILDAFQNDKSEIRVLVATIAFEMGINCKGVYRTIHFGPSNNVESFIQETGRAGRDGVQSVSFVLYQGLMLNHVDKYMKQYVKTDCCRRSYLLQNFDLCSNVETPTPQHLCCDNCASECTCGASECGQLIKFPYSDQEETVTPVRTRTVSDKQQKEILSLLESYHKLALKDLIQKSGFIGLSTSSIKFLLGFSELQISQVLENCDKLFSLDDVVNMWKYGTLDMPTRLWILLIEHLVMGTIYNWMKHVKSLMTVMMITLTFLKNGTYY
jgi:superfamily II DNA helicase RecQ